MATRSIQDPRDRLATIIVAPLMTCSARLPVYALLIGAFIPQRDVGWFNLQGWCCSRCTRRASSARWPCRGS
jgi:ferrous iron transport protein B